MWDPLQRFPILYWPGKNIVSVGQLLFQKEDTKYWDIDWVANSTPTMWYGQRISYVRYSMKITSQVIQSKLNEWNILYQFMILGGDFKFKMATNVEKLIENI